MRHDRLITDLIPPNSPMTSSTNEPSNADFSLEAFRAAQLRISGRVRHTPLIDVAPVRVNPAPGARLLLKLDNLQPTGSFKVRGACNTLMTLNEPQKRAGLITASGGNHGLGVAYAAAMVGCPAVIYLPTNTSAEKAEKAKSWGAEIQSVGAVWDEANLAALARAEADGLTYIHPFADPRVIHGQGTIALEILDDTPETELLLVAIGGGGLIAGAAAAAKAMKPGIKVIGIEPTGAPTHYKSREAGAVITLENIKTRAGTLAPRRSDPLNFDLIQRHVDDIVLVTDADMERAARWLWYELGIAAELSGAAAIAALMTGAVTVPKGSTICAIVCGAGTDGMS
jgi:threonine dehydratase